MELNMSQPATRSELFTLTKVQTKCLGYTINHTWKYACEMQTFVILSSRAPNFPLKEPNFSIKVTVRN